MNATQARAIGPYTIAEYEDGFVIEMADDEDITKLRVVAGPFATQRAAERHLLRAIERAVEHMKLSEPKCES